MQIYLNEEMEGGATTFFSNVFPNVHITLGKFIKLNRASTSVSQNQAESFSLDRRELLFLVTNG